MRTLECLAQKYASSEVRKRVLRTLAVLHAVRSAAGIQRGQTSSAEAHSAAVAEEVTATSDLGSRTRVRS
jgi:hypothetical protein